jgi:hypothetical protein
VSRMAEVTQSSHLRNQASGVVHAEQTDHGFAFEFP